MVFVAGNAVAQDDERAERDAQKTKQAQAVSKEVYDKIAKAQEQVEAKDYQGALRALNNLYNPDKLTEYEQANVLNYIGFVEGDAIPDQRADVIVCDGFSGNIALKTMEGTARQPEASGDIRLGMIIAAALIEGFTFFGIVVALLLVVT